MIDHYHSPSRAHVKNCPECQARMEFLRRLQTEVVVIGQELGLPPSQAVGLLTTLAANMAEVNGCLGPTAEHMLLTADLMMEVARKNPAPEEWTPGEQGTGSPPE